MMRKRHRLVWGVAIGLVLAGVSLGCVDGVTPDCSNPAVCAPSEGALPDARADASNDAGQKDSATDAKTTTDASSDAPADGG